MRLAKLTLNGFKSFADPAEFTFDRDITGIVGPNGCGKSNVVDAIKWVLGERSSKSLRGTEMLDVIFAGSAARKPSGMASVTLTFENPVLEEGTGHLTQGDPEEQTEESTSHLALGTGEEKTEEVTGHQASGIGKEETGNAEAEASVVEAHVRGKRGLPIDADIVEVERRLYRDGTSKYLINGRVARLRDIRDLFLDTGIGADAYSIIEQGKVDAMLLANPQERRTIFEEAAGIAKYKQRRLEAQRKLDRTQVNLTQARDELDSTERRLRLVRGQAAKARKFQSLDLELRSWRMALAFESYDDLRQRLEGLTSQQAHLETARQEVSQSLSEVEAQKQELDLRVHEAIEELKNAEHERLSAEHERVQATQRREMTQRALEGAESRLVSDARQLETLASRLAETETATVEQRETVAAMAERLGECERALAAASGERAKVMSELTERRSQVGERRARASQIDRERAVLQASIQAEERRADAVREQCDRLAAKGELLGTEAASIEDQAVRAAAQLEAAREQIASSQKQLTEHDDRLAHLASGRRERAAAVAELEQESVRLESRRATLREMAQARVGYAQVVREVMDARDRGEAFARVVAPLAELIQTEPGHEAAVESALGPLLQALVVPTLADLPPAEELAKLRGRATFIAMESVGAACVVVATESLEALSAGRMTRLREMVKPRGDGAEPEKIVALLDRVLGSTLLVEHADAAMLLGASLGTPARFVTRDGLVLEPDGRVIAGPLGAGDEGGLLQRRGELEHLDTVLNELAVRLDAARAELASVDGEAAALNKQASELRSRLAGEQRQFAADQARLERLEADAARSKREHRQSAEELAQLRQRIAKIESDRTGLRERAESLARLHDEQVREVEQLESGLGELTRASEAAAERMTSAKVEVGRLAEQVQNARREASRLEMTRDDLLRQQRDLAAHVEQAKASIEHHREVAAESLARIEAATQNEAAWKQRVDDMRGQVEGVQREVQEVGERVAIVRTQAQGVERDWHSLEVARRELEIKRENLEERTQEDAGIDLAFEYSDYREMMREGVARIAVDEAQRQVDTLREQVRSLGSVNLDAIGEESQLAAQNDDLVRQVADLDAAKVQLEDLIARLNEVSRTLFAEVFERIRENFGGQDGMFRRLFGGGRAEVRLMGLVKEVEGPTGIERVQTDEIDVLESGVEVIAKPPGKEPRSISQLSGGEKTLTAVALLMAIFRSKPSCFCVLDEVDAALDEGNVTRFASVIRQFTDHSRFIVITHNKRTMQATDQLFGVTMQERGVSKRVSVRFEQVGKDGQIHGTADARNEAGAEARGDAGVVAKREAVAVAVAEEASPTVVPTNAPVVESPQRRRKIGSLRDALANMREETSEQTKLN